VDASLGGTVARGMVRLLWSFKCSKHGFHVLETWQQPDFTQNHA